MPILESLKIGYKSQPAVTTKQGHQQRIMRKIGCKKNISALKLFSHHKAKHLKHIQVPKETVLLPQVNTTTSKCCHTCQRIGQTQNMLASSSRVLNVTVHRLIWHNMGSHQKVSAQSFTSRHSCGTAIGEVWLIFYSQPYLLYNVKLQLNIGAMYFKQSIVFIWTKATNSYQLCH